MITITMHRDKRDRYTGFTIKGHADYDEAGSDIVCAAVSALSQPCWVSYSMLCKTYRMK